MYIRTVTIAGHTFDVYSYKGWKKDPKTGEFFTNWTYEYIPVNK